MKTRLNYYLLAYLMLITKLTYGQIVINTSFDDYTDGNLSGQNNWIMQEGGDATILTTTGYIKTGTKGVQLASTSAMTVQLDHVGYDGETTGLTSNVFIDTWVKINTTTSEESFQISAYDLTPNGSERRACQFEFSTLGVLSVYNGSSKVAVPTEYYTTNEWIRLSASIDYATSKYEAAINGNILDTSFDFRESYDPSTMGRSSEIKEYHLLRFLYEDDISDLAIDDVYIGTNEITDIPFTAPSTDRTITITQPNNATIILSPQQDIYQTGDVITATLSGISDHYVFENWTGSFSGSETPLTITLEASVTLGASIIIDNNNPPNDYNITLNQSTGGTISISPDSGPYYEGAIITFTAVSEIGYTFDSWTGIIGESSSTAVTLDSDLIVSAVFKEGDSQSREINVSTASELEDALENMLPGDHILLADGTYAGAGASLKNLGGSSSAPVIVEAINQGKAKITGSEQFSLTNCAYITFAGLDFDVSIYTLFKLTGSNNIRISHNIFKNSGDGGSKLILIGDVWDNTTCVSHHNRIDYNLFDGKDDIGAWVVIDGTHGGTPAVSQYDRIDHNHFRNNGPRAINEKETIRIGLSDLSLSSAFCSVDNNLFEECDGDPEIISVKSGDNYIRNNTFIKSLGTVSLRHGDRTEVSGNFFLGQGKTAEFDGRTIGCGGVRIYGKDHKIFNNYFEGLTGSLWDAACTLTQGDASNTNVTNDSDLTKHYLAENLEFTHNTLINNASDIEIGYRSDWGKPVINCLIANNIIIQDSNPVTILHETGSDEGISFADNIIYTTGDGSYGDLNFTEDEATNIDPQLESTDCIIFQESCTAVMPNAINKLTSTSPAINVETSINVNYITMDAEGQALDGLRDLGCDEYNTTELIINGVLSAIHVGPDAVSAFSEVIPDEPDPIEDGLSLDIPLQQYSINIYPNPFVGMVNLVADGQAHVTIYTISGAMVDSFEMNQSYTWNAPKQGIYIAQFTRLNGEKTTLKLLSK